MRHTLLRILILASALTSLPSAGVCRDFKIPELQPKANGYVRTVFDSRRTGRKPFLLHTETKTWFQGGTKFRIEDSTTTNGRRSGDKTYMVRDGKWTYGATRFTGKSNSVEWLTLPPAQAEVMARNTFVQPHGVLREAKLVGYETIHGLRAAHWRGVGTSKTETIRDVWISTDSRFPMVLKAESKSARGTYSFRVTDLKIMDRVPGYIFTAQVSPKPGILPMLALRYKLPLPTLLLKALLALCWFGLVYSTARHVHWRNRLGKAMVAIASLVMMALVLSCPTSSEQYFHSLAGTLVILGEVIVVGAAIWAMLKFAGQPGDASLFRYTTGFSLVVTAICLVVGFAARFSAYSDLVHSIGLKHWVLQFHALPLVNIVLFYAAWAALEEVVFRGYILQSIAERTGSLRVALWSQTLLFCMYHIPGYISIGASHSRIAIAMFWMFLCGMTFGTLRIRYRNLGVPWLAHIAFNAGIFYASYAGLMGMLAAIAKQ